MGWKSLLTVLAVLTTIVQLSYAATTGNRQGQSPSVIVVDAGVSGLRAATLLLKEGYHVTVLEAQNRLGGRVHTIPLNSGKGFLEEGAEWVHGAEGNVVYEMVQPLGLLRRASGSESKTQAKKQRRKRSIDEDGYGNEYSFQTGELVNKALSKKLEQYLKYVWDDPKGWEKDYKGHPNVGDWARYVLQRFNKEVGLHKDPLVLEAAYDWVHRKTIAEDPADNWFDLTSLDHGDRYTQLEGHGAIRWKPPYSYHSFLQLILTGNVTQDRQVKTPSYVKLNKEVVNIDYSKEGQKVKVTTKDGGKLEADHVICTPSLGVLKAKHETLFTPKLPAKQQRTIKYLAFGTVSKIGLEFPQRWWDPDFQGLFPLWTDKNYTATRSLEYYRRDISDNELLVEDKDGIPLWARAILSYFNVNSGAARDVLRIWVSGRASRLLDRLDNTIIQAKVMKAMRKHLAKKFPHIPEPVGIYKSAWEANPFVRGTYSYRSVESDKEDVWAKDLGVPILTKKEKKPFVCFAGEATHPTVFSTVHGAYETGTREAERIINYYKH